MQQCNNCANFNCNRIQSGWDGKGPNFRTTHRLSKEELSRPCGNWTEPSKFKETILANLFCKPRQIEKAFQLINNAGLVFVETNRRPWFRLELK